MKMLMICCSGSRLEELRALVERHGIRGYSEIPSVHGIGQTGRHMGSRAWPGTCAMLISAVEDGKADELMQAIETFRSGCLPEEGVRAMLLPVERMV